MVILPGITPVEGVPSTDTTNAAARNRFVPSSPSPSTVNNVSPLDTTDLEPGTVALDLAPIITAPLVLLMYDVTASDAAFWVVPRISAVGFKTVPSGAV